MPTYEMTQRFKNDLRDLTSTQKALVRKARREFVQCLKTWEDDGCVGVPRFPKSLGVKPVHGVSGIMEFAWDDDGRATWEIGVQQRPRKMHVIWRRIGTHAIYKQP